MKTTIFPTCALLLAQSVWADDATLDDGPRVVPYRPTVSTPAQLSAPGYLELEAGGLRTTGPEPRTSRDTIPYALKLAFTPDWGVRIDGDAWVRQVARDRSRSGNGDLTVVLKRRIAIDDASDWGLELGEKIPTAGDVLGSGHADATVNGIYSSDFSASWHADLNLNETRLGADTGQPRYWLGGWAAAVSRILSDTWSVSGELSGTHQASSTNTSQMQFSGSYNASPGAVFDFGFAHGFTTASPRFEAFAGVTMRLGKLF